MFTVRNALLKDSFNCKCVFQISKRTKRLLTEEDHKNKALAHFDDFYKSLFKSNWPSIRLALLTKGKNVAVINNFGDVQDAENILAREGALEFKKYLKHLKSQNYGSDQIIKRPKNKDDRVDEVLAKKYEEEKEKDLNYLHPQGNDFEGLNKVENEKSEKVQEDVFDITEARSSLHHDKSVAEYEENRLITPDSNSDKSIFYEFLPATQLRGLDGYVLESDYYKYYSHKSLNRVDIVEEEEINFPEHLKVYCFDRGDVTMFPSPTVNAIGVYDFLEMDGADLLPVLALNVQPGDYVLHLSYNSGSIGYCLLQTLNPKFLICSGTKDFDSVFKNYLYNYHSNWNNMLYVTPTSFFELNDSQFDSFDKILVDVPSTNDKHALFDVDANLFRTSRLRQRLELPQKQTDILSSALNLVRPGGTVVYTTSTLSPVQNDGVVNAALSSVWKETQTGFTIKDLSPALRHMSFFYNFDRYLYTKYGTLVVPFVPTNFGPRYFCKIVKNET